MAQLHWKKYEELIDNTDDKSSFGFCRGCGNVQVCTNYKERSGICESCGESKIICVCEIDYVDDEEFKAKCLGEIEFYEPIVIKDDEYYEELKKNLEETFSDQKNREAVREMMLGAFQPEVREKIEETLEAGKNVIFEAGDQSVTIYNKDKVIDRLFNEPLEDSDSE